jgi:hypothetical protein
MALPQAHEVGRLAIAEQFLEIAVQFLRGIVVEEIVVGDHEAGGREAHRDGGGPPAGAVHRGVSRSRERGMIQA